LCFTITCSYGSHLSTDNSVLYKLNARIIIHIRSFFFLFDLIT